jgi:Dolichyl-phosphate-mannose-protein mannosyltransferase
VKRDWKVAACLLAGVYLFSGLSPVGTSFDSRWSVHIAMSLWQHGDTNLDEYSQTILNNDYYAVECVSADGQVRMGAPLACAGHWYNIYPVGGPVLTAPLVAAAVGVMKLLRPLAAHFHSSHPVIAGFLRGDYDAAHPLIEMEVASFLLAMASVVIYFIARRYLDETRSIILALLYALATPAYSIGGRALWQHSPSMLLLAIIILMLLRAEEHPSLAAWVGLPVALSYTVRPTDSLFVIFFTAYVAIRYRRYLLRYLLAALPVAALFVAYNYSIYHDILSPYYHSRLDGFYPRNWPTFGVGLAGNLVSPARGLLIYTPVFLFSIWSMARGLWQAPLKNWLSMLALAHWVAVSSFVTCWWAGMCYGPRFFSDVTPVFVLFLIPYLAGWEGLSRAVRIAFVVCALIGLGMHLRAGWSIAVYDWNVKPVSVDLHPERNWDWSDPPFLR